MPTIEYQYQLFEFRTSPLTPVSEDQYNVIKKDFEKFVGNFLEEKEEQFKKLKNPHRFNFKVFLITIGIALVLGFGGYLLEKADHENIGGTLDFLAVIFGLSIIVQPVQWLLSAMRSPGFSPYERDARAYFLWHRVLVNDSRSYGEYETGLLSRSKEDFELFRHQEI